MKRRIKPGLLPLILIAIAAGIGAGLFFPDWLTRIFLTFDTLFATFLDFIIPLLIVAFVAPAIADIGRGAGRMLLFTVLLAYFATICTGGLSYLTSSLTFPNLIDADAYTAVQSDVVELLPYFTIEIEPLMTVMTALVLALVLGMGTSMLKTTSLRNGLNDFRDIISMVIRGVIVPLLPLYIFGLFLNMTVSGTVVPMLRTFAAIVLIIFIMHVALLVLQYAIASLFSGANPFKALWVMMPAYMTALGTQSSAATIPVTLRRTIDLGVDKNVAGFVVPLCATIHMSGSTLKIVACALALMITNSYEYDFAMFAGFIAMLAITMVAAPGVPGGAIMASLGLLSSMLGFTEADNAMMISLYIAMDSFGTACNVTGDAALAQIVNRFFGRTGTLRHRIIPQTTDANHTT